MAEKVGIVGVGYEGFRSAITDLSTRELMYQAASKAYADAGVDPRADIGSFICCTEDLWEGWSITDEMVPDQIGGARRPLCTVPADGIIGMGHAVMHIRSGVADVVAVEAHSKVADVLDKAAVENLALDPAYLRPQGVNGDVLAGLEMSAFMKETGYTREDVSAVVKEEKKRALTNERATYGGDLSVAEIGEAEPISVPLRKYDKSEYLEGGIVVVMAAESWIRKHKRDAVYVDGIAWRSTTPWYEGGPVGEAAYAKSSFAAALKQAGKRGFSAFDVLEVDDTYSYKLLQHMASMGIGRREAERMVRDSTVNPSGGSLGEGYLLEATGLMKVLECVLQVRGTAGACQVNGVKSAAAISWRGNPTATGAAVVLSRRS